MGQVLAGSGGNMEMNVEIAEKNAGKGTRRKAGSRSGEEGRFVVLGREGGGFWWTLPEKWRLL